MCIRDSSRDKHDDDLSAARREVVGCGLDHFGRQGALRAVPLLIHASTHERHGAARGRIRPGALEGFGQSALLFPTGEVNTVFRYLCHDLPNLHTAKRSARAKVSFTLTDIGSHRERLF